MFSSSLLTVIALQSASAGSFSSEVKQAQDRVARAQQEIVRAAEHSKEIKSRTQGLIGRYRNDEAPEKEGSVEISAVEESPRKKKLYVPTFVGLMNACGLELDAKLISKGDGFLESWEYYYERWIVFPHFREQVRGFLVDAELKKNPKKAMVVMRLYVEYVIACLKMFEEYKNTMSVAFRLFIGEMLMHTFKPELAKSSTLKFRKYIIPFRRNWDNVSMS